MSTQLLNGKQTEKLHTVSKNSIPNLDNSGWTIYHLDNAVMCRPADTFGWYFTINHEVHDACEMPPYNVWKGTWEDQGDGYKIKIKAINTNPPAIETCFELIFVTPDVFIALKDSKVIYSGIRKPK